MEKDHGEDRDPYRVAAPVKNKMHPMVFVGLTSEWELQRQQWRLFWEVVGLERGPLSLVMIIEELLERTVAAPV
jgi:hypothetical protein